jgi:hypothetical protein
MRVKIHSRCCQTAGGLLLLLLCAVVSRASVEQTDVDGSKTGHGKFRGSSATIKSGLVSSDQGLTIIGAALETRKATDSNADCSNLAHAIYERAGFPYSYSNSFQLYRGIKEFRRVLHPQTGDLVVWPGHVGIVISPVQHSFFSAMRSGRGIEFYTSAYWQARGQPRFFRYINTASRTQLTASTRDGNLKPSGSSSTESADSVREDQDFGPPSGVYRAGQETGKSMPRRNEDNSASGAVRPATPATVRLSNANPQPAKSEGPLAAPLNKSDQTTSDAQSAMSRNKQTPARHKLQGPEDGVWEKTASKPSPEIPFDSVVTPTRHNEPQLPQGSRASKNETATAGPVSARLPSAGRPLSKEPTTGPVQWEISRYVPRPPWSSSGRTPEPSVPRPPAGRVPGTPLGSAYSR